MRWARERRRYLRCAIALCRFQLGLEEKETPREIGSAEVGPSQVGPRQVGQAQVGSSQIRSNEESPSQVGASQVLACELGPDQIGPSVVSLVLDSGSREFACTQQQGIDDVSV